LNRDDPIRVITLADDRYAIPLAVTVRSLLDRLESDRRIHITILEGPIPGATKEKLIASWSKSASWARAAVEWLPPDYGEAASMRVWGRLPQLTYARINLTAYLPNAARVIVLDSDVLVRTGIGRLWDVPLEGRIAGAVVDTFIPSVSSRDGLAGYASLGLPPDAPYFNAGVMLVDLELWRSRNVGPRALAFARRYWRVSRSYDQDALNAVLAGHWKALDANWQVQPRRECLLAVPGALAKDAWIVHFSGRLKPWSYRGGSIADREFFDVLDRTAWRGWRPQKTALSLFTEFYERRLRRLVYPAEVRFLGWLHRLHGERASR
jgi:lipopolysaccharide biosynthesis glycosyltransferase